MNGLCGLRSGHWLVKLTARSSLKSRLENASGRCLLEDAAALEFSKGPLKTLSRSEIFECRSSVAGVVFFLLSSFFFNIRFMTSFFFIYLVFKLKEEHFCSCIVFAFCFLCASMLVFQRCYPYQSHDTAMVWESLAEAEAEPSRRGVRAFFLPLERKFSGTPR